jgi:hypothetical protein
MISDKKHVAIFWNIEPCSPYVNRRFGGRDHIFSVKNQLGKKPAQQVARQNKSAAGMSVI